MQDATDEAIEILLPELQDAKEVEPNQEVLEQQNTETPQEDTEAPQENTETPPEGTEVSSEDWRVAVGYLLFVWFLMSVINNIINYISGYIG